jgi:hypothetical protein
VFFERIGLNKTERQTMKKMIVTIALLTGMMSVAQGSLIASEHFEADASGTGGIYNTTGSPMYSPLGSGSSKAVTIGSTGFNGTGTARLLPQ